MPYNTNSYDKKHRGKGKCELGEKQQKVTKNGSRGKIKEMISSSTLSKGTDHSVLQKRVKKTIQAILAHLAGFTDWGKCTFWSV